MKEFKPLTESQIELLHVKNMQVQNLLGQARTLQNQNMQRMERMKVELDIPENEAKTWQLSKDGKSFEREKEVKKTTVKGDTKNARKSSKKT